jgi:hypothetical protein
MFQPLSHRKKVLLVAGMVAAIALCDVVFEMSWVSESPVVRPVADEAATPPAAASPPVEPAPAQAVKAAVPMRTPEAPVAAQAPQPLCDVAACAAAYRTFQASDCTYMPSRGVRRLCTKGRPPP